MKCKNIGVENLSTPILVLYLDAPAGGRRGIRDNKSCTPGDFIDDIRPGLRAEMEGQRGMLARVVEGDEIRVGDAIEVMG